MPKECENSVLRSHTNAKTKESTLVETRNSPSPASIERRDGEEENPRIWQQPPNTEKKTKTKTKKVKTVVIVCVLKKEKKTKEYSSPQNIQSENKTKEKHEGKKVKVNT